MDDLILYMRLLLHLTTAAFLISYKCTKNSRPVVSILAALIAGVSLAAAAHGLLIRPSAHQIELLIVTAAFCFAIVRSRGNLGRIFNGGKLI